MEVEDIGVANIGVALAGVLLSSAISIYVARRERANLRTGWRLEQIKIERAELNAFLDRIDQERKGLVLSFSSDMAERAAEIKVREKVARDRLVALESEVKEILGGKKK